MGAPEGKVLAVVDPLAGKDVELDILNAFSAPPPELDFVAPGLKAGTVGAFVSTGGSGKTIYALEKAVTVASPAADDYLLQLGITKQGKVVVLNAEDPLDVLQLRMHTIGSRLPPEIRAQVAAELRIFGLMGRSCNVLAKNWVDAIVRLCEGARLVIVDTLSRWHTADENDNGQMAAVIAVFERIARITGATIIYLHHTSKGAALNGQGSSQQATRGASAIVDNARWQGYLERVSEAEASKAAIPEDCRHLYVKAGVAKQNYGAPTPERWYRRAEGGVLVPATVGVVVDPMPSKASKRPKGSAPIPFADVQASLATLDPPRAHQPSPFDKFGARR